MSWKFCVYLSILKWLRCFACNSWIALPGFWYRFNNRVICYIMRCRDSHLVRRGYKSSSQESVFSSKEFFAFYTWKCLSKKPLLQQSGCLISASAFSVSLLLEAGEHFSTRTQSSLWSSRFRQNPSAWSLKVYISHWGVYHQDSGAVLSQIRSHVLCALLLFVSGRHDAGAAAATLRDISGSMRHDAGFSLTIYFLPLYIFTGSI